MRAGLALQRYLQRHIERGLPQSPQPRRSLAAGPGDPRLPGGSDAAAAPATPARRERTSAGDPGAEPTGLRSLTLMANSELREAVLALPAGSCEGVRGLNPQADLYLLDIDTLAGPTPGSPGRGAGAQVRL